MIQTDTINEARIQIDRTDKVKIQTDRQNKVKFQTDFENEVSKSLEKCTVDERIKNPLKISPAKPNRAGH